MTTRAAVFNNDVAPQSATRQVSWSGLLSGDDGAWVRLAEFSGKSFQINGTLGSGGTVIIEGSNDATNPTNAAILSNWQGTALSTTSLGFLTARDMPIWVRPRVTAGDGTTAIQVTLAAHRADIAMGG